VENVASSSALNIGRRFYRLLVRFPIHPRD
jgi:hypothetical protein